MRFLTFGPLLACSAISSAGLCQSVDIPKGVLEKLQQQQPAQARQITVAPGSPAAGNPAAGAGVDADRMRSLSDLLEQVENNRGAQSGTVKAVGSRIGTINLQFDLSKVRGTFSTLADAPFGEALSSAASDKALDNKEVTVNTPAVVEYRVKDMHDSVQKIVSIKSSSTVAANAFASADKPVSLTVNNAGLSATQVPGSEAQLPVNVVVGGESRQMKVGDVSRFGNFEVTILASFNYSGKVAREGLPYSLRLQVMPVQ